MWRGGAKISILLVAMKKYLPAPCLFNSISFGCCCRTGPSVILTGAHTHITCRMQGGSVGVCVGGKAQSGTLGSRQNCFLHDFPWWHHTGCTACPQAQCWHRNVGGLSPCLSCDGRIHCSFGGSGRGSLSLLYQGGVVIHAGTVTCFPFASASAWHISPRQNLPPANFFILLLRDIQTFSKIGGVKMQCFPPVKILLTFF